MATLQCIKARKTVARHLRGTALLTQMSLYSIILSLLVLSVGSKGYIWFEWAEIPGPLVLCFPGTAGMQNGAVSGLASPPPLFFSLFSSFLLVVEEKKEEEEGRGVWMCMCVWGDSDSYRAVQVSHQPTVQEFRLQLHNHLGSKESKVQVNFSPLWLCWCVFSMCVYVGCREKSTI